MFLQGSYWYVWWRGSERSLQVTFVLKLSVIGNCACLDRREVRVAFLHFHLHWKAQCSFWSLLFDLYTLCKRQSCKGSSWKLVFKPLTGVLVGCSEPIMTHKASFWSFSSSNFLFLCIEMFCWCFQCDICYTGKLLHIFSFYELRSAPAYSCLYFSLAKEKNPVFLSFSGFHSCRIALPVKCTGRKYSS